jgi:formylglycine-generating enzyme required for sulfatase activity
MAVAGMWLMPKLFPTNPAAVVNEAIPTTLTPVIVPTTTVAKTSDNSTLSSPTPVLGTLGNSAPPSPTLAPAPPPATSIVQDDFVDSRGVPMRLVPAGIFIMGSDNAAGPADQKPLHMVNLDTYYIDKYEVTNANYKACVDAGICRLPAQFDSQTHASYFGNSQFDNYPVIYVDWNMSKAYCEWRGTRLPTEAEWEKAARGTDGRTYPWGNTENNCEKANHMGCVGDTSRVGSYEAGKSPYGVYDMVGNIWEWMADFYDASYYGLLPQNVLDPLGPNNGETHAMRGTSWHPYDYEVKVTRRGNRFPTELSNIFGFRCASDVVP